MICDESFVIATPIGNIAAGSKDNAIASLSFVEFPSSIVEPSFQSGVSGKLSKELTLYFEGSCKLFTAEVVLQGTDFQMKVWEEVRKIPFGETRTYSEIALAVGNPAAVRAVGAAVGQNKHLLLIPCHRVVGSDGRLTGYSGGLDRKRWLLNHERRHSSPQPAVKSLFDEI